MANQSPTWKEANSFISSALHQKAISAHRQKAKLCTSSIDHGQWNSLSDCQSSKFQRLLPVAIIDIVFQKRVVSAAVETFTVA